MQGPVENDTVHDGLLEITRPMMIVSALYALRPSLMARPEWGATTRIISGNNEDSSTSMISYLWDTLAQLPGLYREKDDIDTIPNPGEPIYNALDDEI